MGFPSRIESFRLSAVALAIVLNDDAEASRDFKLPASAFNWMFDGLDRIAIADASVAGNESIKDWAKRCRSLRIHPILVLTELDTFDDETTDEFDEVGVEVIYVDRSNLHEAGVIEDGDLPLRLRIMLPDEAVTARYIGLHLGNRHDVWGLCPEMRFWREYGVALTGWGSRSVDRWKAIFAETFVGPLIDDLEKHTILPVERSLERQNGDVWVVSSRDLPFIRDEYCGGRVLKFGRISIPGATIDFHPSYLTKHGRADGEARDVLARAVAWIAGLFQQSLGPAVAGALHSAGEHRIESLPLRVVNDSAGKLAPGEALGSMVFYDDGVDIVLILPQPPELVNVRVLIGGAAAYTTSAPCDPATAYLGKVELVVELERGQYEHVQSLEALRRVTVEIGSQRSIECALELP